MSRRERAEIRQARYAESAEAIAGLADATYRAARRSGNDPVSLSVLATTVGGFRVRVENAAQWLEANHPRDGRLYRSLYDVVHRDVHAKFNASLEPDVLVGVQRTATGRFDPDPAVRRAIRAWTRFARRRARGFGMPVGLAAAAVERAISGAGGTGGV